MEILTEQANETDDTKKNVKLPWHIRNKEKHAENCKKWREKNKNKHKLYCNNWINNNKEKYNEYHRTQQRVYDEKQRQKKKAIKQEGQ